MIFLISLSSTVCKAGVTQNCVQTCEICCVPDLTGTCQAILNNPTCESPKVWVAADYSTFETTAYKCAVCPASHYLDSRGLCQELPFCYSDEFFDTDSLSCQLAVFCSKIVLPDPQANIYAATCVDKCPLPLVALETTDPVQLTKYKFCTAAGAINGECATKGEVPQLIMTRAFTYYQCAGSCLPDQVLTAAGCASSCDKAWISGGAAYSCADAASCAGYVNIFGVCEDAAKDGLFSDDFGQYTLAKCPDGQVTDTQQNCFPEAYCAWFIQLVTNKTDSVIHRLCVQNCPKYSANRICTDACIGYSLQDETQTLSCVAECPTLVADSKKNCVSQNELFRESVGACTDLISQTCASLLFRDAVVDVSAGCQVYAGGATMRQRRCVSACDQEEAVVYYGAGVSQCVKLCDFISHRGDCVSSCTNGYYINNGIKICTDKCDSAHCLQYTVLAICYKYIEDGVCVDACSVGYTLFNGVCYYSCTCYSAQVVSKRSCVTLDNTNALSLPNGQKFKTDCKYGILFRGQCIFSCPTGQAWITNGCYDAQLCTGILNEKLGICLSRISIVDDWI